MGRISLGQASVANARTSTIKNNKLSEHYSKINNILNIQGYFKNDTLNIFFLDHLQNNNTLIP